MPSITPLTRRRTALRAAAAVGLAVGSMAIVAPTAQADPTLGGSAYGYGAMLDPVIPPTPEAASTLPDEDVSETTIGIPGDPIAISGTLNASAAVHEDSDIASKLLVNSQGVEGPYNAQGFGEIEAAEVLVDAVATDVSLVRADAVRAEAVAVCDGDTVTYSANSEIVNLDVGGEDIPLNDGLQQLIDAISEVLEQTTLEQLVSVERNVVTESANGISVDALRINILEAADSEDPPIEIVLGHASVSDVECGSTPPPTQPEKPECSDGVDNDDPEDTLADIDDPGCHTDGDPNNPDSYDPDDDDETDDAKPECSDGIDNADPEDTLADEDDPGCHTDGDPNNPDSYDPNDDDETDPTLARTGADSPLLLFMGVAAAGLLGLAARRRFLAD